jgi:acetolactate synthase-1/2/3 large subunit
MATQTGSDAIVAALQAAGADCVFGLPGTQNIDLFEAMRRKGLRCVVPTSELAASMMANGYARASGKPGVLVTIPGPGFTWGLAGVAEASLDSAAILHITGAPATSPGARFQLQAIDQRAMAAPLLRGSWRIEAADEAPATIARAWRQSMAAEPGPVLVEVAAGAWQQDSTSGDVADPDSAGDNTGTPGSAAAVVARIAAAPRCLLLVGQGCHGCGDLVTQIAERLRAAVVTTTSGRGVVAEDHPLSLGAELSGYSGDALNALIETCDTVLAIGCKFSHNGSRGFRLRIPEDKLIHVDASAGVLGTNYPASIALCMDARRFLQEILACMGSATSAAGFDDAEIIQWRQRGLRQLQQGNHLEPRIHGTDSNEPGKFFAALRSAMPRESHLVTDSGRHQDMARRHFRVLCPAGLITPTNFQSMGFAIAAATGVRLAHPKRTVVALLGDGGLAMAGLQLSTAVELGIRLTAIVFVDGVYGAIRDQQAGRHGRTPGTALPTLDCAALAAAVGADYIRLQGNMGGALRDILAMPGVTLVEVALGDGIPLRVVQAKARAKRMLGARVLAWLRRRG